MTVTLNRDEQLQRWAQDRKENRAEVVREAMRLTNVSPEELSRRSTRDIRALNNDVHEAIQRFRKGRRAA